MAHILSPLTPKRLYQQIATLLSQSIDDGKFPVGSYLPPERDLAEQLRVSRASVREALIALEVQGRVSVRVGAGVLVLPVRDGGPSAGDTEIGPLELLEARLIVEVETAGLAATLGSSDDHRRMSEALEAMRNEVAAGSTRHLADRRFHVAIAHASRNAALVLLVNTLWDQRMASPMQERLETLFAPPERFTAALDDHQRILDAVVAGDVEAAREAMRAHLVRVRESLSRAIEG